MSINSLNSTRLRMGGLNSGLDTAGIVDSLMKVERLSVDKVFRNKVKAEWRLESYNKINSDVMNFANKFLTLNGSKSIINRNAYTTYNANYTSNNNFKVTGSGSIIPGNYKVSSTKLATNAKISGMGGLSKATQVSGSLKDYYEVNVDSGSLTVAGGAQANGSTKLEELVNANGDSAFGFETGKDVASFTINGKTVSLNKTDTVDEAMQKINDLTGDTGVTATFDSASGKVNFQSDKSVTFKNVNGTAFGAAGVDGAFSGIKEGAQNRVLKFKTSDSLADIVAKGGPDFLGGASSLSFKINNGQTFTFNSSDSLDDIMNAVNTSGVGAKMSVDTFTGELTVRSTTNNTPLTIEGLSGKMFGSDSVLKIDNQTVSKVTTVSTRDTLAQVANKMGVNLQLNASGQFEFSINGQDFTFDKNTTMIDVMSKVNNSGAGVKMNYSELTDSFTFSSAKTGSESKVELDNKGSNAFGSNGLFGIADGNFTSQGTDASIEINGQTIIKDSNSFTIDGMKFEITGDFTAATDKEAYTITFTQNSDEITERMKGFVEEYNKLVDEIYGLITEKKNYKFDPLTKEEEDGLTEKEAEKWTAEAKSGIMRNDTVLSKLLTDLRGAVYSVVGDSGMMASDIGINTSKEMKSGGLVFDENKFKSALADNSDKVFQVMSNLSTATDKTQAYKETGFARRIDSIMSNFRSSSRKQITSETKKISDFVDKITEMEKKLITKEERYWQQYARLETLMGNMNSQSDWLGAQLGALK